MQVVAGSGSWLLAGYARLQSMDIATLFEQLLRVALQVVVMILLLCLHSGVIATNCLVVCCFWFCFVFRLLAGIRVALNGSSNSKSV